MKTYLYSRVSTSDQTLEQQERTAYEWLNNNGLKVDEVISDEGVSGGVSYAQRNLGLVLIPKLQAGDLLIVSEISRLGRSMYDLSKLINTELKQRKIRLVIVSMGIDLRCDKMTAIDELILNNFSFAAQLEKQLIQERTISALKVKKQQGVKFGRANETYKVNEEVQERGHLKSGRTRNAKTINNNEFQSFCRILKRTFPVLQERCDSLQANDDLFMLSWNGLKDDVMKQITSVNLLSIVESMKDAQKNNSELFAKYVLESSDDNLLRIIRAKMGNVFNTINTYIKNNQKWTKK